MKGKKLLTAVVSAAAIFAGSATVASADCPSWMPDALCGATSVFDLEGVVRIGLYIVIAAGVLWALWNIIRAGFEYSSAGDDAEKKKKSTSRIISAVVGLIIVVISFTVLSLVSGWFVKGDLPNLVGQLCFIDGKVGIAKRVTTTECPATGFMCYEVDSAGNETAIGCIPK